MRKILLPLTIVTLVSVIAAVPAWAQRGTQIGRGECTEMLMPVVQLKTISRGLSGYHSGIDLMAPYGSPVRAAAAGTVTYAGRYYAYGLIVDILHADGSLTRYAHLSRFAANIRPGTVVAGGQEIGAIGTSGNAHGAHLHFEVRIGGRAVDPKPFLQLAVCNRVRGPERIEEARAAPDRGPVQASFSGTPFIEARPGGLFQ